MHETNHNFDQQSNDSHIFLTYLLNYHSFSDLEFRIGFLICLKTVDLRKLILLLQNVNLFLETGC